MAFTDIRQGAAELPTRRAYDPPKNKNFIPEIIPVLISEHHQNLYRQYYGSKEVALGMNIRAPEILKLAKELDAKTVLDYGCGVGARLESCLPKLDVRSYDPGVIEFSAHPVPADIVACLDVLEHVEPDSVFEVIAHIQSLALKAVYMTISCEDSSKLLPGGKPWHSFVQNQEWWHDMLPGYDCRCVNSKTFVGVWYGRAK